MSLLLVTKRKTTEQEENLEMIPIRQFINGYVAPCVSPLMFAAAATAAPPSPC